MIIARDGGVCRCCLNALIYAVDHIIQFVDADDPLAWEPLNLQGLCQHCHNAKTAREQRRDGR